MPHSQPPFKTIETNSQHVDENTSIQANRILEEITYIGFILAFISFIENT
jgi:hypothetical protein